MYSYNIVIFIRDIFFCICHSGSFPTLCPFMNNDITVAALIGRIKTTILLIFSCPFIVDFSCVDLLSATCIYYLNLDIYILVF